MKKILLPIGVILLFFQMLSSADLKAQPAPLQTEGKWLVNDQGEKISLRGVNIWSRRGTPTASSREDMISNIRMLAEGGRIGRSQLFSYAHPQHQYL